ncbi:MAG: small subunit ribosomal protein S4 [Parcubacteria group bacterium Gr01-1014_70]|nr:MAG: small subunit ribosomal protein S4 [Parcubacteria group bacterium Gr01-1014_70]
MESKCKICRRAGEKLFLKGDRCFTPKCAVVRKPYPPGVHGSTLRRRRGASEYGSQLKEKQKLRNIYHLRENQFRTYVDKAMGMRGADASSKLLEALSLRLDNVVFEAGFVPSRSIARQVVGHGHARVNGKKTSVPSYALRVGDVISLSDAFLQSSTMQTTDEAFKKFNAPSWISLDRDAKTATIVSLPDTVHQTSFNIKLIIEYYART